MCRKWWQENNGSEPSRKAKKEATNICFFVQSKAKPAGYKMISIEVRQIKQIALQKKFIKKYCAEEMVID